MPLLLFLRLGIIIETGRKGGFLKSAFFVICAEQRAKVRACTRPWQVPRQLEKLAKHVSHSWKDCRT